MTNYIIGPAPGPDTDKAVCLVAPLPWGEWREFSHRPVPRWAGSPWEEAASAVGPMAAAAARRLGARGRHEARCEAAVVRALDTVRDALGCRPPAIWWIAGAAALCWLAREDAGGRGGWEGGGTRMVDYAADMGTGRHQGADAGAWRAAWEWADEWLWAAAFGRPRLGTTSDLALLLRPLVGRLGPVAREIAVAAAMRRVDALVRMGFGAPPSWQVRWWEALAREAAEVGWPRAGDAPTRADPALGLYQRILGRG